MLNEERVILMTKMESFAEHEGRKDTKINQYFRSDYVGFQVLKSVISATVVYVILFVSYLLIRFDTVMQNLYNLDLVQQGRRFLIFYILLVGGYSVASYIIYSYRYAGMRKNMKTYYSNLKRLNKMYEKE
ncbi:MAG: hypothetical protein LKF52_01620 [Butyrivibrio sp.]|jgi:hypothetical protein|nr:hypothetical protein [Butyrivibrio sp.]